MIKEVFVDTGAWIAVADADDQFHSQAVRTYRSLLKSRIRLVTTNLVIAEVYIALRLTLGHKAAIAFLENVFSSPSVEIVYSTPALEMEAQRILRRYYDQTFSYTDAVSFALMRHRKIKIAFSFDKHFLTAGFVFA